MTPRLRAAAATLGIAAILTGVPALLWATAPRLVWPASWELIRSRLLAPDDGTLALAAIWAVATVAWAFFAILIALEIAATLRGTPARHLPGLRLPQHLAKYLVATAALLYLAAPTTPATPSTDRPMPALQNTREDRNLPADSSPGPAVRLLAAPATAPKPTRFSQATIEHVVQRGESLWRIAEQLLGDGSRYREIVALNRDLLDGHPDFLRPGWTLAIPATDHHTSKTGGTYTVRKGDTLSDIAREQLGDARRWPEIAKASAHLRQPGGRHLTDPDEIDIGWTLAVPGQKAPSKNHDPEPTTGPSHSDLPGPSGTVPAPRSPDPSVPAPTVPAPSFPAPSGPAADTSAAASSPPKEARPEDADDYAPPWLLPGLAGSGLVLAGGLWLTLRNRRALQFRHRRPGRMITLPPPEAIPAEKTLLYTRQPAINQVTLIHAALLGLATQMATTKQQMPRLIAVEARTNRLTIHVAEPVDLPAPWQGGETRWTINTEQLQGLPEPDDGAPSPYPQLVTIGTTPDGATWLTNLEHHGALAITGNPNAATDLLRYMAAEIAVNRWSRDATCYYDDTCRSVQPISPQRLRTAQEPRLQERLLSEAIQLVDRAQEAGLDLPTARARQHGADIWPTTIVTLGSPPEGEASRELVSLARSHTNRAGITMVSSAPLDGALNLEIDQSRHLTVPGITVTVRAAGLSEDEAAGCAALLSAASELADQPIPDETTSHNWRPSSPARVVGLGHPTAHRPDSIPAGATSLLPAANADYLAIAATTVDDLDRLAPPQPELPQQPGEDPDPDLDADLADWFADTCDRPRLRILGPVEARCGPGGRPEATTNHLAMLTEILSVLATRQHGATTDELAEAIGIEPGRIRKEVMLLRDWLGDNSRTGRRFVPDARHTQAARAAGRSTYQVEDLLVDADLFARLRSRARSRGEGGMSDLQTALTLVAGEPLTRLRNGAWLTEGDRLDTHLTCAIVDVAHIVTIASLQTGDLEHARAAAESARRAAPWEDTPRLDLAAVTNAEGHPAEAQRILEEIRNRDDDNETYPDVPERTAVMLGRANSGGHEFQRSISTGTTSARNGTPKQPARMDPDNPKRGDQAAH